MQPSEWGSSVYVIHDSRLKPHQRSSLLHVPSNYGKQPVPLIVAMHGKGQPPAEFESHTQLSNADVNPDAIVVYPEGVKLQWIGDPESPSREEVDDIFFVLALLDNLELDYKIDSRKIYAVGFSNGGGITDLLASDYHASGRFAAFAISSGAFYNDSALNKPLFSHINPSHTPIPIMEFHGDADPVIHYDGKTTPDGQTYSLLEFFDIWGKRNECDPEPQRTEHHEGSFIRYGWNTKDKSEEVLVHYRIRGFGHGWPTPRPLNNDDQRHGPTYLDATPIVLEFFRKFTVPLE